jgi:hypothetical protein
MSSVRRVKKTTQAKGKEDKRFAHITSPTHPASCRDSRPFGCTKKNLGTETLYLPCGLPMLR